jgi:hypothetical protein
VLALPACSGARTGATARKATPAAPEPDPLLGGDPTKKVADNTSTQTKSVPPVPEYQASVSTAAIATALHLEGGRAPLAIASEPGKYDWTGPVQPATPTAISPWQGAPGGAAPKPVPVLGPPQPIPPGNAGGEVNVAATQVASNGSAYNQLLWELKKRGVTWQKVDPIATGVRFTCSLPHPQNPNAEWVIHVEAADAITAMQEALVRLDSKSH